MPNLTTVDLTSGVPTAGTGTVSTIDALMALIGTLTTGKSTATDTTSAALLPLIKELSFCLQALNTALGTTAFDLGVSTGGSRTLRVGIDTSQLPALGPGAVGSSVPVVPPGLEYETVAASQTAQALGATGGTGDYITGVLVIPATVSPGNVLLLDNATSITIFAGGTNSLLTLHPFFIPLGLKSVSGAWKLTTGANVSCIGIGDFT